MMPRASRRTSRGLLASAAALSTTLLLAAPSPAGAAVSAIAPPPGWAVLESGTELATGAEFFRFKDLNQVEGHSAVRELNILRVDPTKGALRIESTVGASASARESVRDQLKAGFFAKHPPLAGINGSYFLAEPKSGFNGDKETLAFLGVSARDGVLNGLSCVVKKRDAANKFVVDAQGKYEPEYGNQAAVLQYGVPSIARLKASVTLSYVDKDKQDVPSSPTLTVGGINRDPGRAPCPYDKATLNSAKETLSPQKKPAYTTTDEIVLFNDGYDAKTPPKNLDTTPAITEDDSDGVEVSVDATGKMNLLKTARGHQSATAGGYVLQAIGQGAADLTKFVNDANAVDKGYTLKVTQRVEDMDLTEPVDHVTVQRSIDLDESVDIVSGIHRLLKDGEPVNILNSCARLHTSTGAAKEEGADYAAGDTCWDSRTTLGIDGQGRTVLATLTGPRDSAPGTPDGDFMGNVAELLRTGFGVVDAINFDGGGSTTMIVNGTRQSGRTDTTPVNSADLLTTGERPIADSVYAGNGGLAVKATP